MVALKLRTECDFQADHSDASRSQEQQHEPSLVCLWAGVGCIILLLSWLLEEQRLFRD